MLGRDGILAAAHRGHVGCLAGLALAVILSPAPARALPKLDLHCEYLTSEDAAQVEARIRASLLTKEMTDIDVRVSCANDIATVHTRVAQREADRTLSLAGVVAVDAIVGLVEKSVAALLVSGASSDAGPGAPQPENGGLPDPPSATSTIVAPKAESSAATAAPSGPAPPVAVPANPEGSKQPRDANGHTPECRVAARQGRGRAEVLLETWAVTPAIGGMIGLEQSLGTVFYALVAGGSAAVGERTVFRSREWAAAAEIGWDAASFYGLRFTGRIGISLLVIDVDKSVFTASATTRDVGFLEISVSRPVWFGRIALVPGMGGRVFSGARDVNVDGVQQLHFSNPTLRGTLGVLFSLGS